MTGWKEEHCQLQPDEIQNLGRGKIMQRQNIRKVEHEADEISGMPAFTEWVCDAREMTADEYQMLQSITEINTQKAIDDYTEQLIEEGIL